MSRSADTDHTNPEVREALEKLERAVERVRSESGIYEAELAEALDLNCPAS